MEEKGGILHIFFIFVGIALLALGLFYYFTDEKIELKEETNPFENTENNNNNNQDDKNLINQISILNNIETEVTLKNSKKVKIQYYLSDETNIGKLLYDGKRAFETESDKEECDLFYIFNNSIISFCYLGSRSNGQLYVINEEGVSKRIKEFNYNDYIMIPEGITSKDNKLIVNGVRQLKKTNIDVEDDTIDLCNEDEIKENNISVDSPINAEFEFTINNNKNELIYFKTTKTIKEFIEEKCKTVE